MCLDLTDFGVACPHSHMPFLKSSTQAADYSALRPIALEPAMQIYSTNPQVARGNTCILRVFDFDPSEM
jgi:hypothetical protein